MAKETEGRPRDLKERLRELADDYRRDAPSLLDVLACEAARIALEEAERIAATAVYKFRSGDKWFSVDWPRREVATAIAALRASLTEGE